MNAPKARRLTTHSMGTISHRRTTQAVPSFACVSIKAVLIPADVMGDTALGCIYYQYFQDKANEEDS